MEQHNRLDSWKAISAYLNRTVRTCQRWERELALPVHRVHNKKRDMVFAYAQELDVWLRSGGGARALAEPRETDSGEVPAVATEKQDGAEHGASAAPAPQQATVAASQRNASASDQRTTESGTGAATTPSALPSVPSEQRAFNAGSASRRPSWLRRAAAIVLLMAGGATITALLREPLIRARAWFSPPAPASYELEGQKVKVYDARASFLWQYDFGTLLDAAGYERNRKSLDLPYVGLHDLDGDGRNEFLFAVKSGEPGWDHTTFFCFNSNGSIRFTRRREKTMRFGDVDYRPPFIPRGFLVTPEADGTKTVWLSILHTPEFPEVLEKLNHRGEVLGEFWHGGHLHALAEGKYEGNRVIFAGYVENDQRRASMAVLDYDRPTGFAPAQDPYYLCSTCPAGRPLEFFIFPRLDVARTVNSLPGVDHIFVSPQGEPLVHVRQTIELPQHGQRETGVQYKLDADLNFLDAFHDSSLGEVHAQLEMKGALKHRYARIEETEMFPVLRWDGTRFVQVPAPPNFAAARKPAAPHRAKTDSARTPGGAPASPVRLGKP